MGTQFKLEISNKSVLITIIDNVSEDFADDYRNKLDEGLRKSKITVINNNSQPNKTASSIDCCGKYQLYNYAKQMKKRSRTVKSLIYLNFRPGNCKFITLTFNAKACDWDCTDLNACHAAFRRFIKRINAKYKDFQYVAVFARQEIGNWHYHMIANFDDTVREKTIRDLWQYGRTDSRGIFHNSDFETKLSYCVKNMEDTGWEELQNTKAYLCSHNLMRPIVQRTWVLDERLAAIANLHDIISVPKYEMPVTFADNSATDEPVKITRMVSHKSFNELFSDVKVASLR